MDVEGFKAGQKALWALGDFPSLADLIRPASQTIIDAAGVSAGETLLDVACGTGNLAIPAAQRGARVTGIDITPSLLELARAEAESSGLEVDFREGDAEALDFADGSFDKVISVFGMIFAPQHALAAAEMRRTCRPGGTVAITSWTPAGMNGQLFEVMGRHIPERPADMPEPFVWGEPDYVREQFGDGIDWNFSVENAVYAGPSPEQFFDFLEQSLGPIVLAKLALEPQGKYEPLREDLRELHLSFNKADDGSYLADGEYLLAVGRLPS